MTPSPRAAPADLYVRPRFDIDAVYGPGFIRVQLTPEWLELLARRAAACTELQLKSARAEISPTYVSYTDSEVTIQQWAIELDTGSFRFVGKAEGGGNSVSQWIGLGELGHALTFDANPDSQEVPDGFGWYGDSLFYVEDEEVDLFIEEVTEELPQIAAKQAELAMTEVIAGSSDGQQPAANDLPARRRRMDV